MKAYDRLFKGKHRFKTKKTWRDLTIQQRVWFVDRWLYETVSRQGEALRSAPLSGANAGLSPEGIGLYWNNICPTIFSDTIAFGNDPCHDIAGFNDAQKNQSARIFEHINNKFVLNLDSKVPEKWKNTARADYTNLKFLSILIGYKIAPDDSELLLPDEGLAPVFPDLRYKGPYMSLVNMSCNIANKYRREIYAGLVPDFALNKITGHCWRGGSQPARMRVFARLPLPWWSGCPLSYAFATTRVGWREST